MEGDDSEFMKFTVSTLQTFLKACGQFVSAIGQFSEAGLHECMPIVIFHARRHERSQRHFQANF